MKSHPRCQINSFFTFVFPAAARASIGGRKLLPGLILALGLQCTMNASADTDIYSTAGTTNWVCPLGVTSITVECWGGGGAGGGSFVNGGTANAGGGGGGGGAYARLNSVPVTPGNTYTITIPAAAASPTSGFVNGQRFDGSPVTFTGDSEVTVTANGGQGGQCRIVTGATASSGSNGAGAAVGTGLDGAFAGGTSAQWGGGNGNGGGGGAGDLGDGGGAAAANGSFGVGGLGSDVDHTGGNGGAARNGAGNGNGAASPGGGGGGAKSSTTSTTSRRGGVGGLGRIILTYTIPPPVTKTKADNADPLNQGSSWVGNVGPSTTESAKWDNIVQSANTTNLAADLTWAGIIIENPNGPVTIGGANTLTLGNALIDLDLSSAHTADLTLNCSLALGAANVWNVATGRTVTIGGGVSGAFPITKEGAGTVVLSGANTYSGDTTVSTGTMKLGASGVIPDDSGKGNLTVNGTLDLNGNSETINGLSGTGSGIVDTTAASANVTLTVGGNNQSSTFDGILQNSGSASILNLTKTGSGALVLNGTNTLSGAIAITEGTLGLNGANPVDNVTGITMSGGTMLRSQATGTTVKATTPITLGAAAITSTITAPLLPSNSTGASTPKTFDVEGAISGDGNLTLLGVNPYNQYGTVILSAQSNYTGSTLITCSNELTPIGNEGNQNIFVRLGAENALPVITVLTLDGGDGAPAATAPGRFCELNLNGNNQTLAGLTNVSGRNLRVQRVVNNSATTATLTLNNGLPHTYTGQLGWVSGFGSTAYNNLNLTKSGVGVQTLSGDLRYSGNTTVTGGTLSLGTVNPNNELSTVTIGASGVMQLTFAGSDTVDKLFINGIQQRAGTYGHNSTGATNGGLGVGALNAYFEAGTGTLTVTTGPYAAWQAANSTTQSIDLDHDGDGVSNGIEYFIGGPNGNTTGFTALPGAANDAGTLSVTFTKAADYTGVYGTDYEVQVSSTLASWGPAPGGSVTFPSATEVKYTFPAGTKNFARLQVTGP